jgi:hypothetical protein
MKVFFAVGVPILSGFVTQLMGVGWFSGDVLLAAAINVPICIASVWVSEYV